VAETIEPASYQQQPYDSALKALFEEQASEVIRMLLQGAEYIRESSSAALKPPLRTDRVYLIRGRDESMVYWAGEAICHSSIAI
jgi:hypothetical protein